MILAGLSCVTATFIMGSLDDFEQAVNGLDVVKIFKNQAIKPEECVGRDKAQIITVPDIGNHSSTTAIIDEIKRQVVDRTPELRAPVEVTPPSPSDIGHAGYIESYGFVAPAGSPAIHYRIGPANEAYRKE
jgi:hypothetical protein